MIKECSRCHEEKELNLFYKNRRGKNGVDPHCKKCDNNRKTSYLREKSRKLGKKERVYTLISRELFSKGLKKCPGCKEIKTLESFYKSEGSHNGYASHCIICSTQVVGSRPNLKEERRRYYGKYKETQFLCKLKREFNLSGEEYYRYLNEQNGVCAICNKKEDNKRLAVDHCHKTGKIRGLLCTRCNPALGFLQDNIEIAKNLVLYLERTQ